MLWQRENMLEGLSDSNFQPQWSSTEGPWPSFDWYGLRMVPEDPGVRYLGPWAQYTFPQKGYSLDQQARPTEDLSQDVGASPSAKRAPTVRKSPWLRRSGLLSLSLPH